jgi:hypothetical protein
LSSQSIFLNEIARIRKRVTVKRLQRFFLHSAVIFLGLLAIATTIDKIGIWPDLVSGPSITIVIVASLAFSLLHAYTSRIRFLNVLIDIDTRLKLKDKISTAYEYHKSGKPSELSKLLLDDAGRRLKKLSLRQIFPPHFSFLYPLLMLLILTNVGMYALDDFGFHFERNSVYRKQIDTANTLLQDSKPKRTETEKAAPPQALSDMVKRLENISQKLDARKMVSDKGFSSLTKALQQIGGEQARLTEKLNSALASAAIENIAIQEIAQLENLSVSKLESLQTMLNRQLSDSDNLDDEILKELQSLAKLLARIFDGLDKLHALRDELMDSTADKTDPGESHTQSQKSEQSTEASSPGKAVSEAQRGPKTTAGQIGAGQAHGNRIEWEDGPGLVQDNSAAGREKSVSQGKSPYTLEKSKGPGIQDKMTPAPAKSYSVRIRSLSDIGQAAVKSRDITRPYRREIETILQKEDIPLNYREYIKNYFMSIGLKIADNDDNTTR